jgi:RNA polymerase sigma-70 factor (sigma-E family)
VSIDSAGFAEFYARARDDCLRVVFASIGDRPLAEDLVAEAFARAWARWPVVSRHPAPAAWVVRTAFNARVSWWRRYRREIALPDAAAEAGHDHGGADDGGIGGAVDRELMAALLRLPERQRQVVALRIFLDLDTAGTARTLGIAPGTVTAHLARAMAALREQLASAVEQEQP